MGDGQESDGVAWVIVAALVALAAALELVSIFPPYYRGGTSVASDAEDVLFTLPALLVWSIAAGLIVSNRTRRLGVCFFVAFSVIWTAAYLPSIGSVLSGGSSVGRGFVLDLSAEGAALLAVAIAVSLVARNRLIGFAGPRSAYWAVVAMVAGGLFAIGNSMPFYRDQAFVTKDGTHFIATGTRRLSSDCCALLHDRGWNLSQDVLLIALAILVPLIAAAVKPSTGSASGLVGAAAAVAAWPLSTIARLSQTPSASDLGIAHKEAVEIGAVFSRHSQPGLWLAVGGAAALLLLGIARGLHGYASGDGDSPSLAPAADL